MSGFGAFLGGLSGGTIGASVVSLILDTKRFDLGLATARGRLQSSTIQMQGSASKFGALAQAGFLAAIPAALAVGKAAINAASDQEEALNKVKVTFEEASGVVEDFADTAADAFGISKAAALEAAGGFGVMLQTAGLASDEAANMSVKLVALAGDLASFNNLDPAEALEKLRSGLAGEAEPLRTVGVLLSEARVKTEAYASGIAKQGSELTEAQKVQARYNLILQDTTKAQGDFARTSDSLANQQRVLRAKLTDLAATIGQAIIPAMSDFADATIAVLGPLTELVELLNEDLPGGFSLLDLGIGASTSGLTKFGGQADEAGLQAALTAERVKQLGLTTFEANDIIERGTRLVEELAGTFGFLTGKVDDVPDSVGAAAAGIAAFADAAGQSLKDFKGDVRSNLNFVRNRFQDVAGDAKLTGVKIARALRDAARDQENFAENVDDFRERVAEAYGGQIPDAAKEMIAEIASGGEKYKTLVAALATATDGNIRSIVKSWRAGKEGPASMLDTLDEIEARLGALSQQRHTIHLTLDIAGTGNTFSDRSVADALAHELVAGGP